MSTLESSLAAFRGRSVFITGHTGFKGSWLALWLARCGARIHGYSLDPPTSPSNFEAAQVRDVLASHTIGDIRDTERLTSALHAAKADVVFHLAAQPLVLASYAFPRESFEVNVIGTAAVLDAVRTTGRACAVIVITSDKCYENQERVWGYRECDPMGGHDPYSASKGAAEILVASYRRSFFSPCKIAEHGVRLASARAGNVIGGGDWASDRIVTDIVTHLRASRPVPVRNPLAIRPWQHVLEPLSGYLMLAARLLPNGADSNVVSYCSSWNFGPALSSEATVKELVNLFCEAWGQGTWTDESNPAALHEANILRLSIDKAICLLSWQPRWSLRETVERTARWYKTYYAAKPAAADQQAECLCDIQDYERFEGPLND